MAIAATTPRTPELSTRCALPMMHLLAAAVTQTVPIRGPGGPTRPPGEPGTSRYLRPRPFNARAVTGSKTFSRETSDWGVPQADSPNRRRTDLR